MDRLTETFSVKLSATDRAGLRQLAETKRLSAGAILRRLLSRELIRAGLKPGPGKKEAQ